MNKNANVFLYRILKKLFLNNYSQITYKQLIDFYPLFKNLLSAYNLKQYRKCFKSQYQFLKRTLLVFSQCELGVFKNNELIFYENPTFLNLTTTVDEKITDNLVNEFCLYFMNMKLEDEEKELAM